MHAPGIEFLAPAQRFFNAFRAPIFSAVWRQRIQEPCRQQAAVFCSQFGEFVFEFGERHANRLINGVYSRKLRTRPRTDRYIKFSLHVTMKQFDKYTIRPPALTPGSRLVLFPG